MERIVSRSELQAVDGPQSVSPEPEILRKIGDLDEFEYVKVDHTDRDHPQDNDLDGNDELDFRLFAASAPDGQNEPTQSLAKIRLESPQPTNLEPGFVRSERDPNYYFALDFRGPSKENFKLAAVTGEDVLTRSKSLRPGSSYEWKVLHLPATKKQVSLGISIDSLGSRLLGNSDVGRRKRLGKKARIKVRVKLTAAKAKREQKDKANLEKEAAEREKRTRRNREKKVKKKVREKAKKADIGEGDVVELPA